MKKLLVILLSVLLPISFSLSIGCKEPKEPEEGLIPPEKLKTSTIKQEELMEELGPEELEELEKSEKEWEEEMEKEWGPEASKELEELEKSEKEWEEEMEKERELENIEKQQK